MALQAAMPEDLQTEVDFVKISKALNRAMNTSYYCPETLKQMSPIDMDNLIMAVTVESIG